MPELPGGTITVLMTDVEGSTSLWERDPAGMSATIAQHDAILARVIPEFAGHLIKSRGEGDSSFSVFARATDAVAAALEFQRRVRGACVSIRVRAALHSGEAQLRDGDYFGTTINRCARLRSTASGGQILLSQACHALVRDSLPAEAAWKDHGQHRLKDLLRPERVYELVHPELAGSGTPLRSLSLLPHNLPLQLTTFVGRDREVAEVSALLEDHRLVTLLGVGGSGKTRLSLQVGAECAERFSGGVWQVELSTVGGRDRLLRAICDVLTIPESGIADVVSTVAAAEMLLILDNCEQIVQEVAEVAEELVMGSPGLRILTTSREALRVRGEAIYRVPSLNLPPEGDDASLAEIEAAESVRLFVDRAKSRQHNFTISSANALAVGRICRRLAGIPLAIEQAASNVDVLSPSQILERWEGRFPALSSDERHGAERHETLRACFDWSYEMLGASERMLFGRLAVFSGGWTLEAAQAVCSDENLSADEILTLLHRLVSKSIVVSEDDPSGLKRFKFLEPVRQYAEEKMLPVDRLEVRHLDWCLELAARGLEELAGAHQALWLDKLHAEHDNFRAALGWSLDADPRRCLDLAASLRRFWFWRGYYAEGKDWLWKALRACPDADLRVRAAVLNAIGGIASQQAELAEARDAYQQSLSLWSALEEETQVAAVGHNIGILFSQEVMYTEAIEQFQKSGKAYATLGDRKGLATVQLNLGVCRLYQGHVDEAIEEFSKALAEFEEEGDAGMLARCNSNLALAHLERGSLDEAVNSITQAFAYLRETQDAVGASSALLDLAVILARMGDGSNCQKALAMADAHRQKAKLSWGKQQQSLANECMRRIELQGCGQDKSLSRWAKSLSPSSAIEAASQICAMLASGPRLL